MSETKINIYEYIDFRRFLQDYYTERRACDKKFTHAYICQQMGLPNTRSYFKDILSGKRNLSNTKTELLVELLELQGDEAQFFRILVLYSQTDLKGERDFLFDQMVSLNKTPLRFVDRASYDYFSEWYHSAIRALLDTLECKGDPEELAKVLRPSVPIEKITASLELLKKLKLISPNDNGILKPTSKTIAAQTNLRGELVKNYQSGYLKIVQKALEEQLTPAQKNVTKTISISQEGYERIQNRIEKFLSEISSIIHKDDKKAERVVLLNMNFLPLSVSQDSESKD